MAERRQQLLILYMTGSDLRSGTAAWSFYDGADGKAKDSDFAIREDKPPFGSVMEAMKAGWRVLQISEARPAAPGEEYHTSFLKFETVLEKLVEI
jgi:hypothetical protein